jgi:hypothetical protein
MTDILSESKNESKTEVDMEALLSSLKSLEPSDLFKVMKQAISEAEKRSKTAPKAKPAVKKAGSMPKGQVPPQLKKPRAWVDFTLKHALENGWESFTIHQKKKDKETGEKSEEEIEMSGSILHEGAHVYKDSVTEKNPSGKQLIHKDAMSLSKQRWDRKEAKGSHQELYEEFESNYVEEDVPVASETSKVVVKMTAAEKKAASDEKKALKEQEKEEKKALKEQEKAEKKALKEQEKAEKKKVPAAAVAKPKVVKAVVKAVEKVVEKVEKVVKVKKVEKVEKKDVVIPADGMVHPWPYKGKQYLRNSDNEIWLRGADGGCGEWQGIYMPAEDRIDDSVPEPEFEDE